jgi:hypothetical protein
MKIVLGPWPAEKPLAELRRAFEPLVNLVDKRLGY